MEYCIDLLVEELSDSRFSVPKPYETVWGPAYRAEEVGKFVWRDGLYVEPQPVRPSLLLHLPENYQSVAWKAFTVGGKGWNAFEQAINASVPSADIIVSVHSLFHALLDKQPRWAVFFWYQCDEMAAVYSQTVEELCKTINTAYRRDFTQARGFCSLASSHIDTQKSD